MITSGISWPDITRMVKDEKKAGNALANIIHKMNLEKNSVTLILDAVNEDEDEDQA
jgi:predicted ribosome quality control (RQC) complex YloA/Tae2 family protein